ncbi:glycosyltransferase family 2 protein [Verrucomicrobiota bacterium sgz303538]
MIVLTKNEEKDLPALLNSLRWCTDIHVVDDESSDGTLRIAQSCEAKCYRHVFESFGKQRNWALENCDSRYPWILFLDADEVCTPAFVSALRSAVATADDKVAGFYCCWKMMLDRTWLKRCDGFPKWQFRVLRHGRASFVDSGHGQKEGRLDGTVGYIHEPYLHYAFSKGWTHWLERHNRYSSHEAKARLASPVSWRAILTKNSSERNKALKPLVSRLPGWPVARFLIDYVGRGGFVEGRAGFIYCVNMAVYEYFIRLKMADLRKMSQH